ncbi:MAG: acyltransferase [Alphaproteobacteria bacterium]|jgi:peptidoglycan/LPS O-acetylase OafA/YrhL|nr:MAG: acyltransferase [Alphaproteobacteria bacterium]
MAHTGTQQNNFVLLDGLRGLGAVLVLIGHSMAFWGPFWAPSGAVIVDLFFLLSGFVIAFAYEPRLAAGMRLSEFMTHRIVRLYPLYFLGMVIGYVGLCAMTIGDADGGQRSWQLTLQLIPQFFMMPAPEVLGDTNLYSLNSPAWTLFFEVLVNLVYVAAFRWLRNTKVLIAVVVGCAIALALTVLHFGKIDAGSVWSNSWAGFARSGFGFFAGVLAFRLLGSPKSTERPISKWAFVILVAIPIACFIPATPQLRPFVDLTLAVILGIPLLWISQSVAPPTKYHALFITGGRISYAIYILHQPFCEVAKRINWRTGLLDQVAPLGGIVILVFVLTLAYFAERYFDRPVRRFIVAKLRQQAVQKRAARASASMGFAD